MKKQKLIDLFIGEISVQSRSNWSSNNSKHKADLTLVLKLFNYKC